MTADTEKVAAWSDIFRRLFDASQAQVALLDLQGDIVATNDAWQRFGRENGMSPAYECVGKNYLQACEAAAARDDRSAKLAYVGLLQVLRTRRPKFTMVYPCHHPTERRWYRMWVEPQMPQMPAVIVAHYFCRAKPLTDASGQNRFSVPGESNFYSALALRACEITLIADTNQFLQQGDDLHGMDRHQRLSVSAGMDAAGFGRSAGKGKLPEAGARRDFVFSPAAV